MISVLTKTKDLVVFLQLNSLFGSPDIMVALCTSDLDLVFEIRPAIRQDFFDVVTGVCAINMSVITRELSAKYGHLVSVLVSVSRFSQTPFVLPRRLSY